jgi:hypothetical protein
MLYLSRDTNFGPSVIQQVACRYTDCIIPAPYLSSCSTLIHFVIMKVINSVFRNTNFMKNGVFWDVTQCGSCKIRRLGGTP